MAENLTILERRRIEAEILKLVFEVIKKEDGRDKAEKVISQAVELAAANAGKEMRAREGSQTGTESLAAIQHLWQAGGALECRVLKLDRDAFDYEVMSCAYARMYQEMGLMDLGFILSCRRDSAFVKGYAPDLDLERDKTIMLGDEICRFHYFRKKPQEEEEK